MTQEQPIITPEQPITAQKQAEQPKSMPKFYSRGTLKSLIAGGWGQILCSKLIGWRGVPNKRHVYSIY